MNFRIILAVLFLCILANVVAENVRTKLLKNGNCNKDQYTCLNNNCVRKYDYCNGIDNCGDNSDEIFCNTPRCPNEYFKCYRSSGMFRWYKCISTAWRCDRKYDCPDGEDEIYCTSEELMQSKLAVVKENATTWLFNQRKKDRILHKWGTDITKKAIALFLSRRNAFNAHESKFHEIACDLNSNFLSKVAFKKIEDVHSYDLASYINAFLVTCIDPRKFYVIDLVHELRKRVDTMNYTNPFAFLTLCNAQETITEVDVQKLLDVFAKAQREFRTDIQAMALMALSCASKQPQNLVDQENLSELALELKRKQTHNGTIDNIKTTALVMQALFASESQPDQQNFNESKAVQQIIQTQENDGSFGGMTNTYYVLPILSYLSLVNISSSHCPEFLRSGKETLQFLNDQIGDKFNVKYSLLIGDNKNLQRTLTLNVPKNTSFYRIMELAADLDAQYHFKYNVRDMKPYIYYLSNLMDDPESELFWIPYYVTNETTMELKLIDKSPIEVFPKDKEHLVFWYKRDA